MRLLRNFERVDAVLLAAAVVGIALYLIGVPRAHPDRAVRNHVPKAEVVTTARAFLARHTAESFEAAPTEARIRRAPDLLDSLQHVYGRSEAVRLIRDAGAPAYYWEVVVLSGEGARGDHDGIVGGSSPEEDDARLATVRLTLDGLPLGLSLDASRLTGSRLHGDALRALAEDTLRLAELDSVSADRWTFRFNDRPFQAGRRFRGDERGLNDPPAIRPFFLPPEARVLLSRSDASSIARYHLRGTPLDDGGVHIDSVATSGEAGRPTATAYVSSVDSAVGRRFTATVEVAPTGALLNLEPTFAQERDRRSPGLDDAPEIIRICTFIVLGLIAFVVFVRRFRYRLVDVGAAFRDGVLAALASGVALAGGMLGEMTLGFSFEALMMMAGLTLLSLLGGVLIFIISASSSTARDDWSEKLRTLDLVREAYVRNVPVGRSLVRGTLIGIGLAGILSLGVIALPVIRLPDDPVFFTSVVPGAPFITTAASLIFSVLLVTYVAIVNTGALVRKKTTSFALIVGVVAFTLALIQVSPLDVGPSGFAYLPSAALGLALGWTLWRFDILTVLVALFSMLLLWETVPGWVVPNTPEVASALLAFVFIGGIGAVGLAGVAGGRSSADVPVIVPDYIEELARHERLERELELARSMQMSFLPREQPDVPGLDVASLCLPAYEVGGDYYDFFRIDARRLGFAVGDVSGKGMEAAFYMTLMKGMLQSLMMDDISPSAALARANELFRMNASRSTFMSMALGVLDADRRILTYARAGHNPMLLRRSQEERFENLKPQGPALGLTPRAVFNDAIEEISVRLEADDTIVIYTDGVTEAMNPRRELYGEERLADVLAQARGDAHAVLQRVVDDVDSFRRGAPSHDDMTLVVIRTTSYDHPSAGR